jgi:hypothetical protein
MNAKAAAELPSRRETTRKSVCTFHCISMKMLANNFFLVVALVALTGGCHSNSSSRSLNSTTGNANPNADARQTVPTNTSNPPNASSAPRSGQNAGSADAGTNYQGNLPGATANITDANGSVTGKQPNSTQTPK